MASTTGVIGGEALIAGTLAGGAVVVDAHHDGYGGFDGGVVVQVA